MKSQILQLVKWFVNQYLATDTLQHHLACDILFCATHFSAPYGILYGQ